MTPNTVHSKLDVLLQLHFPDEIGASRSYWKQPNYLLSFYQLARDAYGIVNTDRVRQYLTADWQTQPSRNLQKNDLIELEKIADAWDCWQFALLVESGYFDAPSDRNED